MRTVGFRTIGSELLDGRIEVDGLRRSVSLRVLLAADQLAAGLLGVVGAHQRLADQHGVDAHPLELLDLLARADAALRDDRLAGRHVGEQLERALEVDREVATGRGC